MEAKKTEIELPNLERSILDRCLFPESFHVLCEESRDLANEPVVADAIKNLLHLKLLTAINSNEQPLRWMYDVDRMGDCRFVATAKGLDLLHH